MTVKVQANCTGRKHIAPLYLVRSWSNDHFSIYLYFWLRVLIIIAKIYSVLTLCRHYAKMSTWTASWGRHCQLTPFYRWENWGTQRLRNLTRAGVGAWSAKLHSSDSPPLWRSVAFTPGLTWLNRAKGSLPCKCFKTLDIKLPKYTNWYKYC